LNEQPTDETLPKEKDGDDEMLPVFKAFTKYSLYETKQVILF